MLSPAEENALRIYIAKIEKQNEKMKLLATSSGFYSEYFKELKTAKSNKEAFDSVNEEYHQLFGIYRYADHNSFMAMTNYYNKKNKLK